jgi:hypothetical protein
MPCPDEVGEGVAEDSELDVIGLWVGDREADVKDDFEMLVEEEAKVDNEDITKVDEGRGVDMKLSFTSTQ